MQLLKMKFATCDWMYITELNNRLFQSKIYIKDPWIQIPLIATLFPRIRSIYRIDYKPITYDFSTTANSDALPNWSNNIEILQEWSDGPNPYIDLFTLIQPCVLI